MKKLLGATMALFALLVAAPSSAEDSPFGSDAPFADAKTMAAETGKPILLDFYATW